MILNTPIDKMIGFSWALAVISALLYQNLALIKIIITGRANMAPRGIPVSSCQESFFSFSLLLSQYLINIISSLVSIV